jgi:NAD(P)-dependent dehydrogenase (short-subunit alcohol dehydrogenase family)
VFAEEVDVSLGASVEALANRLRQRFGCVLVLVNKAAHAPYADVC